MDTLIKMPLLVNDTVTFDDNLNLSYNDRLKHPYVTTFHLLFRSMAIFWYLFCGLFSNNFITSFVITIIILSLDFWTVKNISGRLMVGLRWWNYVADDGKSTWVFESKKNLSQNGIHPKESYIFWMSLFLCQIFWLLMFIFAFFTFRISWLLLVCIAISLNGANLYGYIRCNIGQQENIMKATADFFREKLLKNALSTFAKKNENQRSSSQTNI